MTTVLSQIEKEIYIAGWFSNMKIVRLFLCPDMQKQRANIQSRAGKGLRFMPYIAPEVVQEAKQMDLLTYLKNYEPYELVHFLVLVYKCGQEKLNNLYYQMKEQRR